MTSTDRSALERLLGIFTEVRAGEGRVALLLTLDIFLILTAYYTIKPLREALILAAPRGEEWKSYASAGQALLLLGAVPLYAWLAGRASRRRLIDTVTLFFVANLGLFFLAVKTVGAGSLPLGLGFFLWVGVFNLMVPAQFWSLANDLYSPEQGKRLFVIVAFGASMGAVLGSKLAGTMIGAFGLEQLPLAAAGLLLLSLWLSHAVQDRSVAAGTVAARTTPEVDAPVGRTGAFTLVLRDRYLLWIALLMFFLNWVNSTGEFLLGDIVKTSIAHQADAAAIAADARDAWVGARIGEFYADFFFVVNVLGVVIQLFLVSRIFRYLGIRVALLVLPIIALGAYSTMAFVPLLAAVRWAKTLENATDYSLQNTVRQTLFLPTTREEKYKAKQAIDTFFVRAGDVLSAVLVGVGIHTLGLTTRGFALVNLGLVLVWLLLAVAIGREHARRVHALTAPVSPAAGSGGAGSPGAELGA